MGKLIVFRLRKKRVGGIMCKILKDIYGKSPQELLNMYEISTEPPIDISKLIEKMKISTIAMDFTELERDSNVPEGCVLGATFSNGDNLTILYKKTDTLHRKKFTIAHEIAHCCLHCPKDETSHIELRLDSYPDDIKKEEEKKEKDANIFAGELLIPKKSLKVYYDKLMIPSLLYLSELFDVSTNVMEERLNYLELPYYKDQFQRV